MLPPRSAGLPAWPRSPWEPDIGHLGGHREAPQPLSGEGNPGGKPPRGCLTRLTQRTSQATASCGLASPQDLPVTVDYWAEEEQKLPAQSEVL